MYRILPAYSIISLLIGFTLLGSCPLHGQNLSANISNLPVSVPDNSWAHLSEGNIAILHREALDSFFNQLKDLYFNKSGRLNIVHIGDSHIQAGFLTQQVRDSLQHIFGNAGLGFTFPYRLAKTNGIKTVQYHSSTPWDAAGNVAAKDPRTIGLSGFSFTTDTKNFGLRLDIQDEKYFFNRLKIFTPDQQPLFRLAQTDKTIPLTQQFSTYKTHLIKSGEALSIIAQKYKVSMAKIKAANGLRSDLIRAGAKLKIPVRTEKPQPIEEADFNILPLNEEAEQGYYSFNSTQPLQSVWLLPNPGTYSRYALNGIFLENDTPGIIYSGIGVNGARFSDYNKTPLFFNQLQALHPDLIIVSLGTNEAHGHISEDRYLENLSEFIHNLQEILPGVSVLLTTPPPMLDKRRSPNTFVAKYTDKIMDFANSHPIAVWDLYQATGSNTAIRSNFNKGLFYRDFIHLTEKGYMHTGKLFTEALLEAFYRFQNQSDQ